MSSTEWAWCCRCRCRCGSRQACLTRAKAADQKSVQHGRDDRGTKDGRCDPRALCGVPWAHSTGAPVRAGRHTCQGVGANRGHGRTRRRGLSAAHGLHCQGRDGERSAGHRVRGRGSKGQCRMPDGCGRRMGRRTRRRTARTAGALAPLPATPRRTMRCCRRRRRRRRLRRRTRLQLRRAMALPARPRCVRVGRSAVDDDDRRTRRAQPASLMVVSAHIPDRRSSPARVDVLGKLPASYTTHDGGPARDGGSVSVER